MQEAFGYQQPV